MTPEEIEQLAGRIARLISRNNWLPAPVRPATNRPTAGSLPVWAGASQHLDDVAPGNAVAGNRHRPEYAALVSATRAAAAGDGPSPLPGGKTGQSEGLRKGNQVAVAVSNRHIHICREKFEILFGPGKEPTVDRKISQPGQYAARERLRLVGPGGSIEGVRIVGPLRDHTQVELAHSDCRKLGIEAPVRDSGSVAGSAPIRLEGPHGSVDLSQGVIVAAGHLHLGPMDAQRMGLNDGDRVSVRIGSGPRVATLHDVLVRSGPTHSTEVHIDTDEANALGVNSGDTVTVLGRPTRTRTAPGRPRRLVTERDVSDYARRGEQLTDCAAYIVTPAARDRARALGIWRD